MIGLVLLGIGIVQYLRGSFYSALLIFLFFVTSGFQIVPAALVLIGLPGAVKLSDFALVYVIVISLAYFSSISAYSKEIGIYRPVLLFLTFLLIEALYSFFVLDYSLSTIIRSARNYLFVLSFFIFFFSPVDVLQKLFKLLMVITLCQCVIYLIQIPLNQSFLTIGLTGGENISTTLDGDQYVRYYNTPILLTIALFYFIFVQNYDSLAYKALVLSLIVITVVAPMHRSLMLINSLIILYGYFLLGKIRLKDVGYMVGIFMVAIVILANTMVGDRLASALDDFQEVQSASTIDKLQTEQNTFAYRIALFYERFNYVIRTPESWLFGLGLLTEDAPQAKKLNFTVGLKNEWDEITQIDTGDNLWPLLLIRLGILGTFLYAFAFGKTGRFLFKNRGFPLSLVGFLFIIQQFLLSFTNTDMFSHWYYVIAMFFLALSVLESLSQPSSAENQSLIPAG